MIDGVNRIRIKNQMNLKVAVARTSGIIAATNYVTLRDELLNNENRQQNIGEFEFTDLV